ncbi:MAG TPA: FxSxx-COOH system tetratricopeptide repeat protein [Ktedonobacteraceae bacterium]
MTVVDNELSAFGALLKTFRKRRRLTQQQLATGMGVHRSAIIRWEQGDFLPESRTSVLELARCLHLDGQEARQLLEASLTALAPYWGVPLPRNLFFTGREEVLQALHTRLGGHHAVALTQSSALHGLGGVGKTQIALEYAYRHALEYSAIFWIAAETQEQVIASLLRIAGVLGVAQADEAKQQQVVAVVQHWLATHGRWLLIWDNLEDLDLLSRFLPASRQGANLLTTRQQALGTLAHGLDLSPMEQEESMLFLVRRARVLDADAARSDLRELAERLPAQYAAAEQLVTALGGLPLALDQAGAYMEETRCGLPAYLELFRARRLTLLQQRGERARAHPESVATTFTLAIAETAGRHRAVWDLLCVCALLQSDAIPEELFEQGAGPLGEKLAAVARDQLDWDRVVAGACSYSLLHRQPEERTLSMHRLVQAVLLDALADDEREQWSRRVVDALDAAFPDVLPSTDYAIWQRGERLLPHALLCLSRPGAQQTRARASLGYKAAQYLRARGRYAEAEPLYQRSLRLYERLLGSEHPEVARTLNYLAILYWSQGRYSEAEPLYLRTLHIREQVEGPEHPDVAASLNNLALLYWSQGRYSEAEPLYLRTLRIRERTQGPAHIDVATSLNNLASLYLDQGRYAEAEPLYLRVLPVLEQTVGHDHPLMAQVLNNLALVYREQGRDAEAEPLFQGALRVLEQALGPEHPDTAQALNNLANLCLEQGRESEAEQLFRRALHISEQGQDVEQPTVAMSLVGLANLCRNQGKDAQAEPLYQRALSFCERRLGEQHPDTAQVLHELAIFRQRQCDLAQALSLVARAHSIRAHALGETHPRTAASSALYARLLQAQTQEEVSASERGVEPGSPGSGSLDARRRQDGLQAFLSACCELHPGARCRVGDLWRAYERWIGEHQESVSLSRRTFAAQLQAHGCRSDRTSSARIWRGVALRGETS